MRRGKQFIRYGMDERKKTILKAIVWEYVKTKEPVSSFVLTDKYRLNVSSATIRNEMQELDEMGYLMQPHISGGRIPTDRAYRFFVDEFAQNAGVSKSLQSSIDDSLGKVGHAQDVAKESVKVLSRLSKNLSINTVYAPEGMNIYSSGYEYLLNQDDMWEERIMGPFWILDNFEEYARAMQEYVANTDDIIVMIGKENPFSILYNCSVVFSRYAAEDGGQGILGIVGPRRMDYRKNIALIQYVKEQYL